MKWLFLLSIIVFSITLFACDDTPSGYVELGDLNVTLTMDSTCHKLAGNPIVDKQIVFWATTATTTIKMVPGHHTIACWDDHNDERWKIDVVINADTTILLDCRW
ncbi:MAG: hypothetical protein ABIQ57_17895 [Candidatus Kapaibacterium sp.]